VVGGYAHAGRNADALDAHRKGIRLAVLSSYDPRLSEIPPCDEVSFGRTSTAVGPSAGWACVAVT